MGHGHPSAGRSFVVAASCCVAALGAAAARADLDARVQSGDRFVAEIAPGGDVHRIRVPCADGDVLTATIRAKGRGGVRVRVLDDADGVLAEMSGSRLAVTSPALAAGEVVLEIRAADPLRVVRTQVRVSCGAVPDDGPRTIDVTPSRVGPGVTHVEADRIGPAGGTLASERWTDLAGASVEFAPGSGVRRETFVVAAAPDLVPATTELAPVGPAVVLGPASRRFTAAAGVLGAVPYRPATATRPLSLLVAGVGGRVEPVPGAVPDAAAGVIRFPLTRFGTFQVFEGTPSVGPVTGSPLAAFDPATNDRMTAVATTGTRIVSGAETHGEFVGSQLTEVGAAYVFERTGNSWQQVAKLLPSDRVLAGKFGHSVAADGDAIAVGAPHATITATSASAQGMEGGTVYVFERIAGRWTETARIASPSPATTKAFGADVALSGSTLVVGAPLHGGASPTGAVFVYTKDATGWTLAQTIVPSAVQVGSLFGQAVGVAPDTLAASTRWEGGSNFSGAVYAFGRRSGAWSLEQRLVPAAGAFGDAFGCDVSVLRDRVVAGASRHYVPGNPASGAAYVFERTSGTWSEVARIDAPAAAGIGGFGAAVATGPDRMLIGAPGASVTTSVSGAVWLVKRGTGAWNVVVPLAFSGIAPGDALGGGVALRSGRAAIAAAGRDVTPPGASAVTDAGAVYVTDVTTK